jgi:hypothetical protein
VNKSDFKPLRKRPLRYLALILLLTAPLLMAPKTVKVRAGGRVSHVSGKANVKRGQLVKPGQAVITGSNGRVELTFSDGSRLRIGSASHLLLVSDNPAKKQTLARLSKGRVWNQVRPAPNKKVVIRGRHSVAAVLGTTYEIQVSETQTQTSVIKGNVGIHRPFEEIPETSTQDLFQHVPGSMKSALPPSSAPNQGMSQPKEVASPVHEIPAPMKVIPGPVEVSLEQWLQIVENQQITIGEDGKAEVKTIDPVQRRKADAWFQWNTQMDAQPASLE